MVKHFGIFGDAPRNERNANFVFSFARTSAPVIRSELVGFTVGTSFRVCATIITIDSDLYIDLETMGVGHSQ